ncbi:MAG: hypothetical protein DRQ88_00505 [Epsilonproteobacteria bacterium]|nr:MAG: hypothetical protein DRQ89_03585 [Campylobacterota bacterium]RLA68116.1 MAG: hypothetical protein DRQ88_00505 [Campylobacterota bacterium]
MKLSKVFAIISLLLFLATYFLGNTLTYLGNDEESNRTFQPFSFLIPEGIESVPTKGVVKEALGDKLYYYIPRGIKAYLIGFHTLPFWQFDLKMVQMPEGAKLYFCLTDLKGAVAEINVLNHYVGLAPLETIAPGIRKMIPFIFLFFTILLLIYIFRRGKYDWMIGLVPSLMIIYIPVIALLVGMQFSSTFSEHAVYKLDSFNPLIFGTVKLKNVELTGYPGIGFYLFLLQLILMGSSIFLRRQKR